MPRACADGVGKAVEDVHIVCNQHSVSDEDAGRRPYPRTLSDIAPRTDLNLPTVSKRQKLTQDHRVASHAYLAVLSRSIADSGGSIELGAAIKNARRAPQ